MKYTTVVIWDYFVILYLLFGVNHFYNLLEFGDVEFIVEVIGDQTALDVCTVNAYNIDVQNVWDVPWKKENIFKHTDEFNYSLNKLDIKDGIALFTLHGYKENPDRWEKAVPPPGEWNIVIEAEGYKTVYKSIITNSGGCYELTAELEKN